MQQAIVESAVLMSLKVKSLNVFDSQLGQILFFQKSFDGALWEERWLHASQHRSPEIWAGRLILVGLRVELKAKRFHFKIV